MKIPNRRLRPAAFAAFIAFASLLSCGREITGPGAFGRLGEVALHPVFGEIRLGGTGEVMSIGSVVDFDRVRLLLLRQNGDTAVDRVVNFPPDSTSIRLSVPVTLGEDATRDGEVLSATLKYINATGDTVFTGGPSPVTAALPGSRPPADQPIVVLYTGRGANAAALTISPTSFTGTINQQVTFSALVQDTTQATITAVPVAYTSTDSARVGVNLRTGVATLLGARGSALVIAQTLTGQADTAVVNITPSASALALVSGGNQQVRQGEPFAQPVRVRVTAVDNAGVAGVPVLFEVTRGQGSAAPAIDTTDSGGFAEAIWTAGDSAGVGTLRASVVGRPIELTVSGTQLSSSPTALTLSAQPSNIVAGDPLPAFNVVVRDATGDTVRAFNGAVTVSLSGGTGGANLVGEVLTETAANGVAPFSGLTVDRAGSGYRLVASVAGGPTVQSTPFDVSPSVPTDISLVRGGGQTVPPSTVLPDSIVVRVTDTFGLPKSGVTVNFTVTAGGGTASPASVTTDAAGRAATQWTAGPAGAQQLRASAGQLPPIDIAASVQTGGGSPLLFLAVDQLAVSIGRSRSVTVFLTSPTPGPLQVDFAMRSAIAEWSAASLTIPAGGSQVTALLTGIVGGVSQAVVTSAAGSDSMEVVVDSASASIDILSRTDILVGDTLRTVVILEEPAPIGGLTVTVRSLDSASVLVAPGTGRGLQAEPCLTCGGGLIDGASLQLAPGETGALRAPPSGTATITIPAGQFIGHLVVLPIALQGDAQPVQLTLEAPGFLANGTSLDVVSPDLTLFCYTCGVGPGQVEQFYLRIPEALQRDQILRLTSLDPALLTVIDSVSVIPRGDNATWEYLRTVGVSAGTARVVVSGAGLVPDTLLVEVSPRALTTFATTLSMQEGSSSDLTVYVGYDPGGAFNYGATLAAPLAVSMVSRDAAVVSIDRTSAELPAGEYARTVTLRAVTPGSTWVVYSAPGYPSDSTEVIVSGATIDVTSNSSTIGAGQLEENFYIYLTSNGNSAPRQISVSSSDPSVVNVLTPSVAFAAGQTYAQVRLHSVNAGFATLSFAGAGLDTATTVLQVLTPTVTLQSFSSPTLIDADSAQYGLVSFVGAGFNYHRVADTLVGRVRSTDPSVLVVTDSVVVWTPREYVTYTGVVRGIAPGTAQLVLDVPGHAPDTSALVTVRPSRLAFTLPSLSVGNQLRVNAIIQRLTPPGSPLEVGLALSGPSGATLAQPLDTFPAGGGSVSIGLIGGTTPGTDTLIATAAGLSPDTLLITTVRSSLNLGTNTILDYGEERQLLGSYLTGPAFNGRETAIARRFVVTSLDTLVARLAQDTIEFAAGAFSPLRFSSVLGVGPGTTQLIATSLDGTADGDTIAVTVAARRLTHGNSGPIIMGMQQVSYSGEFYIQREGARTATTWVKLTSSAPAVVSVPDSIVIDYLGSYAYFDMTAGDSVGSATVSFSAPGFVGGAMQVIVTRSQLDSYTSDDPYVGSGVAVDVYSYSAGYYSRSSVVDIPIRFTVRDTTVAVMTVDTTSIPSATSSVQVESLRGVRAGGTTLLVEDRRSGSFVQQASVEREVRVEPARIKLGTEELEVAIGASGGVGAYVSTDNFPDSTWVHVRTLAGRAVVVQDSVLLNRYQNYQALDIYGVSAGIDTLVLDAPGYRTDTAIVRVLPGMLQTQVPLPAVVQQGDSVLVEVHLRTPGDELAYATPGPITLTFATSAGIDIRVGGSTVTTATVPAGEYRAQVWLRGLTGGPATLTVTTPNFLSFSRTITIRSPP